MMCADFDDTRLPLEETSELEENQRNTGVVRSLRDLPDDLYAMPGDPKARPNPKAGQQCRPEPQSKTVLWENMLKDIRSWGWTSIVLGVIHFVASGFLNPSWGIVLVAVGGISFLIREASMYVIYAVTMAWVGLSNVMLGGFGGWTIIGAFQIFLSYRLYRKYQEYAIVERKYLELEAGQEEPANRAKDTFPGCGFALGLVGLVGASGVFVLVIAAVAARGPDAPVPENLQVIDFIMGALLASGILGFALSVAALVSKYPRKWLAWIGALAGGLLMVFEIFLRLGAM
jgi:hypothetical protein